MSIRFKHVEKRYGGVPAVLDMTFSIQPGEIVVLLGPSGCGKTTTLRLLAGLERPDKGEIWLDERQLSSPRTWVAPEDRSIGMVFQDYALFPHLNIMDNVAFGLKGRGKKGKRDRVSSLLALVGLSGLEKRMPHELSGGQQQRVALARALAPQPAVILLDEPFSNLDTALRTQVRTEVRAILQETSTTAMFVTHDQEEALSLADRVAVLFDGELHQIGTPEEIYIYPQSPKVAQFVGEANFLSGQADGVVAQTPLGHLSLHRPAQGPVNIMIRPEALVLTASDADDGVAAQVVWREYYGHSQRIHVELADGTTLTIRANNHIPYEHDQHVRVGVVGDVLAYTPNTH